MLTFQSRQHFQVFESLKTSISLGWFDWVKWFRSQDKNILHSALMEAKKLLQGKIAKEQFYDTDVRIVVCMSAMLQAASMCGPVVEYLIEDEIIETLKNTRIPDCFNTVGDLIKLPYNPLALRLRSSSSKVFSTLFILNGELFVVSESGEVSRTPLDVSLTEKNHEGKTYIDSIGIGNAGLIMYINHGVDVFYKKIVEHGSNKRFRNRKPVEKITGVVGGKFISAMKCWSERTKNSTGEGTHASPKPHYRCGHWHSFWVGKGREKLIHKFLHPCLVNASCAEYVEIHKKVSR